MASRITEKDNETQPVFVIILLHSSYIKTFWLPNEEKYSLAYIISYMTCFVIPNTSFLLNEGSINLAFTLHVNELYFFYQDLD